MLDEPSFYLQMGHNSHTIARDFCETRDCAGVILSPSDGTPSNLEEWAAEASGHGRKVLFDPQFYLPRTQREKLQKHPYFEAIGGSGFDTQTFQDNLESFVHDTVAYQASLSVDAMIAPSRLLETLSKSAVDTWRSLAEAFVEEARSERPDCPILISVPVDAQPLADKGQRERLLNHATSIDAHGFYVSVRHPLDVAYPLRGTSYVMSYLDLVHNLARNEYRVLCGHTHQFAHALFGVGAMGFASGQYKNLRSFDTRRWQDTDDWGQQVVNYYSDRILNELRVDADMDLLYQCDLLDAVRTPSPYDYPLYQGEVPSTVEWKLRGASWDHYLWACNGIAKKYAGVEPEQRREASVQAIEEAREVCQQIVDQIGGPLSEPEPDVFRDWAMSVRAVGS